MWSPTWRRILYVYENVVLGEFSYGPGIRPGLFAAGTRIGRFCSFAADFRVISRNHPHRRISQHPLFFNSKIGVFPECSDSMIAESPLTVGNDVWIGMGVTVCPGCTRIGDGAIVGAGTVITKDVAAFSVVAGNPGKVIRRRFSPKVEAAVIASCWWDYSLEHILTHADLFARDIVDDDIGRFLSAFPGRGLTT
jgi:acetyltransferase-like isoleucine patch superfamily enzyme